MTLTSCHLQQKMAVYLGYRLLKLCSTLPVALHHISCETDRRNPKFDGRPPGWESTYIREQNVLKFSIILVGISFRASSKQIVTMLIAVVVAAAAADPTATHEEIWCYWNRKLNACRHFHAAQAGKYCREAAMAGAYCSRLRAPCALCCLYRI